MLSGNMGQQESHLVLQSRQVSLQTLLFPQQSLNAGQVPPKVIGRHQLLLLLDPADGLIHIPADRSSIPAQRTVQPEKTFILRFPAFTC